MKIFSVKKALVVCFCRVFILLILGNAYADNRNVMNGEVLRDPTSPLVQEKKNIYRHALTLQAVFVKKDDRYALINNEVVRVNGHAGSARVVKIEPKKVHLEKGGVISYLLLRDTIFK